VAAAPTLKEALRRYRAQPLELGCLSVSYNIVAMDVWDDEAWFELAVGQLRLARANGTLSWLPFTLDYLAEIHVQAGELSKAAALLMERERVDSGTREATLPYLPLLLAVWRGDAPGAAELAEEMTRGALDRRPTGPAPSTRSSSRRGPCMSWWKLRHEAISRNLRTRRPASCRS
jgi:hypothetical protein